MNPALSLKMSLKSLTLVSCLGSILLSTGCAMPSDPALEQEPTGQLEAALSASPVTIDHPQGAYFAKVNAMGTGCPAGTWTADIDPLGETFTVRFSAYEAMVQPGQFMSVKDCQLGIQLHSPQGLSYSIASLHYSGYAVLEKPNMSAKTYVKYYFMGEPIASVNSDKLIKGPYEGEFLFSDTVPISDLVWSRCGTQRMLNIPTRLVLKNNRRKAGFGYVNTSAVDGSLELIFNLRWKKCP